MNLNEKVRVKLTEYGKRCLWKYWNGDESSCDICHPGWKDSQIEVQMWRLMQIFGADLEIGLDTPFEGNEIEIAESSELEKWATGGQVQ